LLSAGTRPPILLQASSSRIELSRPLAAVFRRQMRLQYLEAHTGLVPTEARRESPETRRASDCPTQSSFIPYHRAPYLNRDLESWEGAPPLVTSEDMGHTPGTDAPKFPCSSLSFRANLNSRRLHPRRWQRNRIRRWLSRPSANRAGTHRPDVAALPQ